MTDLYCECGDEAIVEFGEDLIPLCVLHFQDALRNVKQIMDAAEGRLLRRTAATVEVGEGRL